MATLHTKRLNLRALHREDAAVIARDIGNYAVCKNLARVPYPYGLADALDFLDWIKSFDQRSLICGVELRSSANLIGVMSYLYEVETKTCELGYWLAEPHWGQGLGREAASAMVAHAFTETETPDLISAFHNDNPASGRILKSLGFVATASEMAFSKAQNCEVLSTTMHLTKPRWISLQHS
jgi:RimJ/RimL family protein N-acetyltransferase